MKPTEDAKMKNDEAGRPMPEAFKDPHHLANTADAMGRLCKSWQGSTAEYHFACRDTIRTQAARIAELEGLVAADFDMLDSTWKARAEAAEARERALLACNNEERKALVQIVSLKSRLKAAEAEVARLREALRQADEGLNYMHLYDAALQPKQEDM